MPRPGQAFTDPNLLAAALEGLELQKRRIEDQIRQVRALIGGKRVKRVATAKPPLKAARKRVLSPVARKNIARAQKRRWAAFRKKKAAAGQDTK